MFAPEYYRNWAGVYWLELYLDGELAWKSTFWDGEWSSLAKAALRDELINKLEELEILYLLDTLVGGDVLKFSPCRA